MVHALLFESRAGVYILQNSRAARENKMKTEGVGKKIKEKGKRKTA